MCDLFAATIVAVSALASLDEIALGKVEAADSQRCSEVEWSEASSSGNAVLAQTDVGCGWRE